MTNDHLRVTRLARSCALLSLGLAAVSAAALLHGCAAVQRDDADHPQAAGWRAGWVMALKHADDPVETATLDCRDHGAASRGDYALVRYSRSRHWKHALIAVDAGAPVAVGDRVWFQPATCAASTVAASGG
ncbi:hypothetical protein [Roseateles chitosanitabidus]|uniref:hypothetical protein n=1 Tax=Roseateles chitosanitabidus TaxID=65048 RepID=UPI00083698DB|nr:hypothetical protein [Roseateles chitosanitabidus]